MGGRAGFGGPDDDLQVRLRPGPCRGGACAKGSTCAAANGSLEGCHRNSQLRLGREPHTPRVADCLRLRALRVPIRTENKGRQRYCHPLQPLPGKAFSQVMSVVLMQAASLPKLMALPAV